MFLGALVLFMLLGNAALTAAVVFLSKETEVSGARVRPLAVGPHRSSSLVPRHLANKQL